MNITQKKILRKHIANTPEKEKQLPRHFNMKTVSLQRDNLTLFLDFFHISMTYKRIML